MFRAVESYLQSIPKGSCLLKLKSAVCQSFHIGEKQFYYILSRLNSTTPTFSEYTAKLEEAGFEIYVSREVRVPNQLPRALVAVSPAMRKAFSMYGDRLSFDLTFRLIKNRPDSESGLRIRWEPLSASVPLIIWYRLEWR